MVMGEPHGFSTAKEGEERFGIAGMGQAEEQARCVQHVSLPPFVGDADEIEWPIWLGPGWRQSPAGDDAWISTTQKLGRLSSGHRSLIGELHSW
jgi:hypothetical protein